MPIRDHLLQVRAPADPWFRWRGAEPSRMEGLSDGIFAVTLTLLVASLDVPETFYDLWLTVTRIPVFAICFTAILALWRMHDLYYRRYGLQDGVTVVLNSALLFLVVCYAYPLKFMVSFLWSAVLAQDTSAMFLVPQGVVWSQSDLFQRAGMLFFYGIGVIGVFGIALLMLLHALRHKQVLELDDLELELTHRALRSHIISICFALISIAILMTGAQPGIAGIPYLLMIIVHFMHLLWSRVRFSQLKRTKV